MRLECEGTRWALIASRLGKSDYLNQSGVVLPWAVDTGDCISISQSLLICFSFLSFSKLVDVIKSLSIMYSHDYLSGVFLETVYHHCYLSLSSFAFTIYYLFTYRLIN